MRTKGQNAAPLREQFVKKGCDRDRLGELLTLYRGYCGDRKTGFDWIKAQLDALHDRLTKLAVEIGQVQREIEQVYAKPLDLFCGISLAKAEAILPLMPSDKPWPKSHPPQDFQTWPALLRSYAESLRKVEDRIVKPMSVRKDSPGIPITMVYLYCREATREDVTYKEIADLLNEATSDITDEPVTEESVRQHLKRERAWYFAEKGKRIGTETEGAMRVATYTFPPAFGDTASAQCVIYLFGVGQGGSVQANLDRWKGQMLATDGKPADANIVKRIIHGLTVTTIDASGHYTGTGGPMASKSVQNSSRLLGAIVEGPGGNMFIKFTGPAKTVTANRAEFEQLLILFDKDESLLSG
jgi:hypothetical protein